MATINNKLIHFKSKSNFLSRYADTTNGGDTYGDFLGTSIVFIQDAKQIWTHGTDYYCGSGPVALKSDLENLDKICFVDLVSELNIDTLSILEGDYSPISSTAKTGTFQKMLTAIQNNQQIVGIYSIQQEDSNVGYLRFESSFAQVSENTIVMYWYNSASIMLLTISNQEAVNLNRAGILTTDQQYSGNKVLVSDNGQTVDESNITTTELNYLDGVTSNIQTQLNGKAASSHNHSAANITSGTLDIARLPSITDAKIISVSASKITGTIPQANLPSYVDDVLEYSSKSSFPQTGESGKIYVDTTTNLTYRWSGSAYVEISPSLALGETSSTAYRGDRGKTAYDHSQATGNPHNLTLSNLGITATATELNYVDGVTSNIQTQLNGKASSSHTHTASQLYGFANVAMSGSYNDLANRPVIPSISVSRSLTSGTKIGTITINGTDTELYAPTNTDTKNTTGTSNNVSKLYLVGGLTQNSAGVITYSNTAVYTQSGKLYANQMNSVLGFYETSDARLKNFKDDIKALDVVSEIPTKYFTWKKDETNENSDSKLHIGTSAQEIQKIYPDLVTENEEGELSVDYARLSVIALAAIKELKKEIDELKSASVK